MPKKPMFELDEDATVKAEEKNIGIINRSDMPAHMDFGSDCSGLFMAIKNGGLHCNECGEYITDVIYPFTEELRDQ